MEPEASQNAFGFSATRSSFWLRPNRLDGAGVSIGEDSSDPDAEKDPGLAFYETRPSGRDAYQALREFASSGAFSLWKAGELRTLSKFTTPQKNALLAIAQDRRVNWPYDGVLLMGRDPVRAGVVWFGVRHEVRWAQLKPEQQALLLSRPPNFLQAGTASEHTTPLPSDFVLTSAAAQAVAAAMTGGEADAVAHADDRLHLFAAGPTRIVVTMLPLAEAEGAALDALARLREALECDGVRIFAREQLASALSSQPWFVQTRVARSVRFANGRDIASLADALGVDDVARSALSRVQHPGIAGEIGGRMRIAGRPGTGKTVAVLQLLARRAPELVVIIADARSEATRQEVEGVVRSFSTVAFVLEDLHLRSFARDDLAWASQLAANTHAEIVVTYASTERLALLDEVRALFSRYGFDTEISLDERPPVFIRGLTRAYAAAWNVSTTGPTLMGFVRTADYGGYTPRNVISLLETVRDAALPAEVPNWTTDAAYWEQKFDGLVASHRTTAVELLRVFGFLQYLEPWRSDNEDTRPLFIGAFGRRSADYEDALRVLIADGWVVMHRFGVRLEASTLSMERLGLIRRDEQRWWPERLTEVFKEFARWIIHDGAHMTNRESYCLRIGELAGFDQDVALRDEAWGVHQQLYRPPGATAP